MLVLLIFWIIAAYGMTYILVFGSIFENLRCWIAKKSTFLGDLLSCPLCTSTWVGFFFSIVTGGLCSYFFSTLPFLVIIFLDGMFTAGAVWTLYVIIDFFENKIE